MKLTTLSVLCLSLLLFHAHFSLAVKNRKPTTSNRGNTHSNTGNKSNQGTTKQHNQKSNNQQPGKPEYPDYPQQPSGGRNQPPKWGSPYGGHYGGRGRQGDYGGHGSYGGRGRYGGHNRYGGYPGGYINRNPHNKILSPRYGGSYDGGHHVGGGSPFSQAVQAMNVAPNDKSKGFGRTAAKLAAGGAIAGMALRYGLGWFPRPQFHFNSSQEEYYFNHYMYTKYGVKSTDTNYDSINYNQLPQTYEDYMDSCMKRKNILPAEDRKQNKKTVATNTTTTADVTSAPDTDTGSNITETNNTVAKNSSTSAPLNQPKASPVPPASQADNSDENDDDIVSVVEIGYPELIEQLKVRRCLELYMVYSENYFKSKAVRVQGLEMGLRGLLAVVSSTLVMLLNINMLTLLH
ncbi:hypothetical protein PAMP_022049 [Pampus punctatissimus]